MKPLFLFLSLTICTVLLATVRTVNNAPAPGTMAQYSTIQAAIDASASGDTIYVQGSKTEYSSATITDKRLTILGPGWSPIKSFNPLTAVINSLTFSGTACKKSELQGLVFTSGVTVNTNPADSMRFIRNHFKSTASVNIQGFAKTYNGYIFSGNWFEGAYIGGAPSAHYVNFLIQNNLFYNIYQGNGNIYSFLQSDNVFVDHNLFYGPTSGSTNCFAGDCRELMITNNIFVRRDAAHQNSLSKFNNNITYLSSVPNPWALNGNADLGGNVENQNPQMFHQDSVNVGINNPLLNFTIAAGPANNTGTDGKDLGLIFDATGMLNWNNSRLSRIPYIYSMSITNPAIAPGSILNVQVEARKSN